jgi:hypothetical protein
MDNHPATTPYRIRTALFRVSSKSFMSHLPRVWLAGLMIPAIILTEDTLFEVYPMQISTPDLAMINLPNHGTDVIQCV